MGTLMKSLKVVFATGIAASMILAGCSKDTSSSNIENKGKTDQPYEIKIAFPVHGSTDGIQEVQDEINKITKKKINATVKLDTTSFAAWPQQFNLKLVGGEKLDLIWTSGKYLSAVVSKKLLLPIDDLLKKDGQDITKIVDADYFKAASIDGQIYGVPSIRDMALSFGVVMRKDVADKYHIDVKNINTLDDFEQVCKTIKENEPSMTCLSTDSGNASLYYYEMGLHDRLGDGIGVLPNIEKLKVVDWFETPEYKNLLNLQRKWYLNGYISKDAATNKQGAQEIIKNDKAFAHLFALKPGIDTQETKSVGKPMVSVPLTPVVTSSSSVNGMMFSIAKNSQNPEKAMQFLNLLYSDKQIINLLDWGIEGRDYEKKSENIIDYPSGDLSKVKYNLNQGYMFGNQLLSYTMNGDDPNLYKELDNFNKTAKKSIALGFVFNSEPVKTEQAAVQNVIGQYQVGLETGTLDPKVNLPKFIDALKAAGIDKIIAEKQNQLDAWAKKNK